MNKLVISQLSVLPITILTFIVNLCEHKNIELNELVLIY